VPRPGSLPADIADALQDQPEGASIAELVVALDGVRRFPVRRASVRSAIYQHLGTEGAGLFTKISRGRYAIRRR
jgi:hypothetical protein